MPTGPNLEGLTRFKNGTVLLIGIERPAQSSARIDTRGRAQSRVAPYVAMKACGVWHLAGDGRVPQGGVSCRSLQNWLSGRRVEWISMSTGTALLWPSEGE